jgi:hypothetical protein
MGMKENGRFINRLVAASPTERRKVSVLGEDVYFKPLTRKQLADAMPKDGVERADDYAGLFLLVQTAEAEDGTKLFRTQDIEKLREGVSLGLLQQLEAAMMGTLAPTPKQVEEDIKADPPSASV